MNTPLRLSVRIDHQDAGHTHLSVFQNGGRAGGLVVDTVHAEKIIKLLSYQEPGEKE